MRNSFPHNQLKLEYNYHLKSSPEKNLENWLDPYVLVVCPLKVEWINWWHWIILENRFQISSTMGSNILWRTFHYSTYAPAFSYDSLFISVLLDWNLSLNLMNLIQKSFKFDTPKPKSYHLMEGFNLQCRCVECSFRKYLIPLRMGT